MKEEPPAKKFLYCAIYTRKSVENTEQDFTSLDAQREAGENYIASQKHEGWIALPQKYADSGFTGANTDRPALNKLISDIKDGKIDCVIVYKVDRLSRSLLDFTQLLQFFDQHNVTFVSMTQHFNTNTSMGRLTLNILLSFAQFEREIISERIKDKFASMRKKGKRVGGRLPLGYDLDKETKRLVINPDEAELIKRKADLYLSGLSLLEVARKLNDEGFRTKHVVTKKGISYGGSKFSVTTIQQTFKNVLYIGKVAYEGQIYDGEHDAILDEETFKKIQEKMEQNRTERKATKNTDCTGLLNHMLRCTSCQKHMFHTYTLKKGKHKYRYYICSNTQKLGYDACPVRSLNAQMLEENVVECLRKIYSNETVKSEDLAVLMPSVWDTLFPQERRRVLLKLIKEISYEPSQKTLKITLKKDNKCHNFTVDLKKIRRFKKNFPEKAIQKEPKIKQTLILAHQIEHLIEDGRIKNLKQVAQWLGLSPARISQIMMLNFLSPAIKERILFDNGKIPGNRLREISSEIYWRRQEEMLNIK